MKGFDKNWCFLPSSPSVSVGDPLLLKKENGRFPTTTLGNDDFMKKEGHPEFSSGSTARVVSRGFTLIELLVVVLIIGILASVALPQYEKAVMKSRYSNLMAMVNALAKAEETYYMETGNYTNDFEALSITPGGCTLSADKQTCSYAWGSCKLDTSGNDRVACVNNTTLKNGYVWYFPTGAYGAWGTSCWALTADKNDKYAKLCEAMGAIFNSSAAFPPYGQGFNYKFQQ